MIPPETMDAILSDITGGEYGHRALKAHGVSPGSFYRALDASPELADRYARARASQMEAKANELEEICDQEPPTDERGKVDSGYVAWQRNRVDTRKWLMAKLAPKKYGERTVLDVTTRTSERELSDAELAAIAKSPARD